MPGFEDIKWCAMIDAGGNPRVERLSEALLDKSFVYCREHGLFYVQGGSHQIVMSLLLAWQHDLNDGVDVADKLGIDFSDDTSELWLEITPGALVMSSVGSIPYAHSKKNLSFQERKFFEKIDYLDEEI